MKTKLLKNLTFVFALFAITSLSAQTWTFDSDLEGFTVNFGTGQTLAWDLDGGVGALKLTRSTNNANFGRGSGTNTDASVVGIDADATPIIKIVIKNLTAANQIRIGAKGGNGTNGNTNFTDVVAVESGSYETYYLDMTGEAHWNGLLTNFWIGVRQNVGTDSDAAYFDSIELLATNPLSVAENTLTGVSIYPNPANGSVNISSLNGGDISVYSILGARVLTEKSTTKNHQLNVSSLKPGMYLLRIVSDNKSSTKKLIIN